jgi:Rhodopirellula transposase DDE domain
MNWSGKPLVSHEVIVNLIKATTTAQGLRVEAEIDHTIYPAGQISMGSISPCDKGGL